MSLVDFFWKTTSQTVLRARFGALGSRSWIRRPLLLLNTRTIFIGDRVFIRDGARLETVTRDGLPAGRITIGDRVSMEQGVHIVACDEIIIEDDVCFAPRCTILDTTHPVGSPHTGNRVQHLDMSRAKVHIKERAFLGANVVVLPNVTIGRNAIVGANSVVTRDIPDNTIAVGAPARVIRHIEGE